MIKTIEVRVLSQNVFVLTIFVYNNSLKSTQLIFTWLSTHDFINIWFFLLICLFKEDPETEASIWFFFLFEGYLIVSKYCRGLNTCMRVDIGRQRR